MSGSAHVGVQKKGNSQLSQDWSRRGFICGALASVVVGAEAFRIGRDEQAGTQLIASGSNPNAGLKAEPHMGRKAERLAAQPNAVFRVETSQPLVALTFDDGPDPLYTPKVLDLLDHYGAKATFFAIGTNALAYPELISRIVESGHVVANHTHSHLSLDRLSPEEITKEINDGKRDLLEAGAPESNLFRPPRGKTCKAVGVISDLYGYQTIFWDVVVDSWLKRYEAREAVDQITARVMPGSIILAHDGGHTPGRVVDRSDTIAALSPMLEKLTDLGLTSVTLPNLLAL